MMHHMQSGQTGMLRCCFESANNWAAAGRPQEPTTSRTARTVSKAAVLAL